MSRATLKLSLIPQYFIFYKNKSPCLLQINNPDSSAVSALTGAARALPARQRRKKIQALIFQQTLNKAEEKEG